MSAVFRRARAPRESELGATLDSPSLWQWLGLIALSAAIAFAYRAGVLGVFGVDTGWLLASGFVAATLSFAADWASASTPATWKLRLRWALGAGIPGLALSVLVTATSALEPGTTKISTNTFSLLTIAGAIAVLAALRLKQSIHDGATRTLDPIRLSSRLWIASFFCAWASAGWYLSGADAPASASGGIAFGLIVAAIGLRLIELRAEAGR